MIELKIDNLTFGGRGVGRYNGKAVFVPYTIPEEQVSCRIVREHKRYSEAELVEVLKPSPLRQVPDCPVFAECGGCQWQHLPYDRQLQWKEQIFHDSLARPLQLADDLFLPIVASPSAWNYRCRAQIKCRKTKGQFIAGFYRPGSHFIVDIEHCPLLAPELNRILPRLKQQLAASLLGGQVSQLDLSIDDGGQLALVVHTAERNYSIWRELFEPVAAEFNCLIHVKDSRKGMLFELFPARPQFIKPLADNDMRLHFPPAGFVQVNLAQNRHLVANVVSQVRNDLKVLDLFCGVGNFSLPLALSAASVVGIEAYPPAIKAASDNASTHNIANAAFIPVAAEKGLQEQWGDEGFDTVILDPPRAGALNVVKQLALLKPQQIIYVSCDPMTLARDLKQLLNSGYRAVSLQPYDMFPQTYHIESITVLERVR